jgi:hypothetical protein
MSLILSITTLAKKTEKQVMNEVAKSFVKLIPYMSDVTKFKEKESEKEIKDRLQFILNAFKTSGHVDKFKKTEFKATYNVMVEHLDETIESFDTNHKVFAYKKLKATGQLCMSCHNMVKGGKKGFVKDIGKVKSDDFANKYDYAEFLYLTKDYRKADRNYRKWTEFVTSKVTSKNSLADDIVFKSAIKVMTINLAVYFTPKKGRDFLNRTLQINSLTPSLKSEFRAWNDALIPWMNWKRPSTISKTYLYDFIKKHLEPLEKDGEIMVNSEVLPTLLITKGLMDKYLQNSSRDESVAVAMYWKSVAERLVGFSYFFSLADMQLKSCIKDYPKSKIAKKCYAEYEKQMILGFSGSAGTNLPSDVKAELKSLKTLISQ